MIVNVGPFVKLIFVSILTWLVGRVQLVVADHPGAGVLVSFFQSSPGPGTECKGLLLQRWSQILFVSILTRPVEPVSEGW